MKEDPANVLVLTFLFLGNCGEDSDELIRLILQGCQFFGWYNLSFDKYLQPISCFIQFFQYIPDFGDEFGVGTSAVSFTVISSNRCTRT